MNNISFLTCDYNGPFMDAYIDEDMRIAAEYGFDWFKDDTFTIYCNA